MTAGRTVAAVPLRPDCLAVADIGTGCLAGILGVCTEYML
ncbi:Hypothetical protein LUCI_4783 [Lucifera butyrica]|uniref:Uncharacterized protein n=1 Tax=Lucifera butyrica TaxID=1351585 RepID=A0A498RKB8_9FIRM|nr:Hypothetical protein LUCI_4783 [Lucifera butyrica]